DKEEPHWNNILTMKYVLVVIVFMGLVSTGLCDDIMCYVGTENVATAITAEYEKGSPSKNFTMCSTKITKEGGKAPTVVRAGLIMTEANVVKDTTCVASQAKECIMSKSTKKKTCKETYMKTCYCDADHCNNQTVSTFRDLYVCKVCNSAPTTVQALMPIIAIAALVKFFI
ncbi:unnamed protein product, partial [Meganyctiphanes norvegica]